MDRDLKRLAVAMSAGLTMCGVLWLFIDESSPAFHYLRDQPEAGLATLILNFPALLLTRLFFKPTATIACALCFVQWFSIGMAAAGYLWRSDAEPTDPHAAGQGTRQKNALR